MIVCEPDCPDRSPTCHATCERYQEFCKKQEEIRAKRKKDYELNQVVRQSILTNWKIKKGHKSRRSE